MILGDQHLNLQLSLYKIRIMRTGDHIKNWMGEHPKVVLVLYASVRDEWPDGPISFPDNSSSFTAAKPSTNMLDMCCIFMKIV